MSRPGFYNDNEYRAYPFLFKQRDSDRPNFVPIPDSAIVDMGVIMGLDTGYQDTQHTVWLSTVTRLVVDNECQLTFVFATNDAATPRTLSFSRTFALSDVDAPENQWLTEYAESLPGNPACGDEAAWSGFMVTGRLGELLDYLGPVIENTPQTVTFAQNDHQLEPARVQNLRRAYLRSISVGNYARVVVPPCGSNAPIDLEQRQIIVNQKCMGGNIRLKEGYNCRITQTRFDNTIVVGASKTSGDQNQSELCEYYGEIPFTADEVFPVIVPATNTAPAVVSPFLSGGPSCKDLMFTINGVSGSNVNLIGGRNFSVTTGDSDHTLKLTLNENLQGGCDG
jgi:hypothetical protein